MGCPGGCGKLTIGGFCGAGSGLEDPKVVKRHQKGLDIAKKNSVFLIWATSRPYLFLIQILSGSRFLRFPIIFPIWHTWPMCLIQTVSRPSLCEYCAMSTTNRPQSCSEKTNYLSRWDRYDSVQTILNIFHIVSFNPILIHISIF